MRINPKYNPAVGAKDFISEFSRPNPYRWPILAVSAGLTFLLMYLFTQERVYVPPAPPEIDYITSFEPGRTDEEIAASNARNQEAQDAIRTLQQERDELRKDLYRQLGRASGLDVDAMEAELAAQQAEEQAQARAQDAVPATPPVE